MKNILYIEDNDDNVYMLRARLEIAGYSVAVAYDGETGVSMAKHDTCDLIIMDLILPGIDGWEATRQIKSCTTTAHIPVIALSSNATTEDRARSLAAGCNDFDTKPVDFNRLLRKIAACQT